jgi:hypothetical protein
MCARKELVQFCPRDFFVLEFFVPQEHRWGDHMGKDMGKDMGKNMGSQFAAWWQNLKGEIGGIYSYENFDTPLYSTPVFLFFRHPNFSSIGRNGRTGHNQNIYNQNYKCIVYSYFIISHRLLEYFVYFKVYHTCLPYKVSITHLECFYFLSVTRAYFTVRISHTLQSFTYFNTLVVFLLLVCHTC